MPEKPRSFAARVLPCLGFALLAAACLGLAGCGKSVVSGGETTRQGKISGPAVVSTARSQLGVPYKYGGVSPKTGFDCSGLIYWSYGQYGFSVPRQASGQASAGKAVQKSQLQQGDIVVFRISGRNGLHTGLYSGNGRFIHSPSSGKKIREDSINDDYWKRRYVSARRVL